MQDTALALALTAANLAVTCYYRHQLHPLGVALVLVAAEYLPLMFRRAHPLIVLTIIGGPRVAYDVIGLGYAPLPLGPPSPSTRCWTGAGPGPAWSVRPCPHRRSRSRSFAGPQPAL